MARHVGACRHVWNEAIGYINAHNGRHFSVEGLSEDEAGRLTAAMAEVSWRWKHPSFMGKENGFSKRFTQMRNSESGAWLRELNFETVRYSLKRLHDTYSRAFDNAKKGIIVAKPQKDGKRRKTVMAFRYFIAGVRIPLLPFPAVVRIESGGIRLPTIGWVKIRPRKGKCPKDDYSAPENPPKALTENCITAPKIKQVVIKRENGKWYAVIFWKRKLKKLRTKRKNLSAWMSA